MRKKIRLPVKCVIETKSRFCPYKIDTKSRFFPEFNTWM